MYDQKVLRAPNTYELCQYLVEKYCGSREAAENEYVEKNGLIPDPIEAFMRYENVKHVAKIPKLMDVINEIL